MGLRGNATRETGTAGHERVAGVGEARETGLSGPPAPLQQRTRAVGRHPRFPEAYAPDRASPTHGVEREVDTGRQPVLHQRRRRVPAPPPRTERIFPLPKKRSERRQAPEATGSELFARARGFLWGGALRPWPQFRDASGAGPKTSAGYIPGLARVRQQNPPDPTPQTVADGAGRRLLQTTTTTTTKDNNKKQ